MQKFRGLMCVWGAAPDWLISYQEKEADRKRLKRELEPNRKKSTSWKTDCPMSHLQKPP